MSTSTNYRSKNLIRSLFSLLFFGITFFGANAQTSNDSCQAEIIVYHDSITNITTLEVEHTGTPNSTVHWSDSSSSNITYVSISGTYCVTVTTETGCTVTDCVEVNIDPNKTCAGYIIKEPLSDGSYMLIAETYDPNATLTYQWSTGSPNPTITVTESGDYCVYISDANGCYSEACITIDIPTPTCNVTLESRDQGNGTVKVLAHAEGEGPFSYGWHNTTADIPTGESYIYVEESGDYCVIVYDANQCASDACIYVEVPPSSPDSCFFDVVLFVIDDQTLSGEVKIGVDPAGAGPFQINWGNGTTGYETYVSESGEYCVWVYDANGCEGHGCIYVEVDPNPIDSCYTWLEKIPQDDGSVKILAHTEGQGPFSYGWHNTTTDIPDGEQYIYVQESGDYCVIVYDANQCASEACIYVEVLPSTTDSCFFDVVLFVIDEQTANGQVKIGVDPAGSAPFQFQWEDGTSGYDRYVSETGEYCVWVYDSNGCEGYGCIYVEVDPNPVDSCYTWLERIPQDNGTVKIWAHTEGEGPFSYGWHNTAADVPSSEPYIYVEETGEYCVIVYDANQCASEACIYVEVEPQPVDSCYTWIEKIPQDDGSVKIWAHTEGTGPFVYNWNGMPTDPVNAEPYLYIDLTGEYCVEVIDANQCVSEACIYVEVHPTNDTCYIDPVLHIIYDPNSTAVKLGIDPYGIAPFTVIWPDGSSGDVMEVTESGEYCVTVVDANNCIGTACKYVEVDPIPTDSCYTTIEILPQDGDAVKIKAHANGAGPFTYVWTNDPAGTAGEPYQYVTESGEYCVIVYDAYQCTSEACVYVEVDTNPVDSCLIDVFIFEYDHTAAGVKKLGVEHNGIGALSYYWNDGQTTSDIYIQESGEYCVSVIDNNGCYGYVCKYIDFDYSPDCAVELFSEVYASDFVAEVKAEPQGTAPFSYRWSNGKETQAIEVYESQKICVVVTDAEGCTTEKCIEVVIPNRCFLEIEKIESSASGILLQAFAEGDAPFDFTWQDGSKESSYKADETGTYCVRLETSSGCVEEKCVYIELDDMLCETTIEFGANTTDYVAVLEANPAGVGPFKYFWSNGSDDSYIVVDNSDKYCVKVIDARGCESEACIEVHIPEPVCESKIYIVSQSDDEVKLSVETAGNGSYEYFWSNGEQTQSIIVSASKEYCVEVLDELGCLSWACLYVEVPNYNQCSVEIEAIANTDSTEWKVIANPTGTAPFTYKWAHGDTSRYFYPELDGYFCVTVTDAEGCVSEACYKTDGITPSVDLDAYPSPTQGDFHIVIDSELEFDALVEIRDMQGNLLFTTRIGINQGVQSLDFNSDEYPVGVFFVNIIRGSHVESIRVVKMGDN